MITRNKLAFEGRFTQIPNSWLRDDRLSWRARGLLAGIMSHEVGWHISSESLSEGGAEGRDAVRNALVELERFGYLQRDGSQRRKGKFAGVDYIITDPFEDPEVPPSPDNQALDTRSGETPPSPEKPSPDNPQQRILSKEDSFPSEKSAADADAPEAIIARKLYDWTRGAVPFMGMRQIAKWAMLNWPDHSPEIIGRAMQEMYRNGRGITRQNLQRSLDSIQAKPVDVHAAIEEKYSYRKTAAEIALERVSEEPGGWERISAGL
jgi:hypothetical protein